ncbi:DEKNAAC103153 [Brettanomyces naardenensis]|uniref:DEKNAAC103153 n=1 Tax=Brettanomyces naardenensis TaxID=13370 RepID=A0A448YML3_BRENA|nr:DEKNAAC103153 [Brettanomyces naardenensis]
MSSSARDKLASIIIVAPVAAGLTLFALIINLVGISHAAATAPAYWIFAILLTVLSFIASALTCVVALLLYYPHILWPCWLLIPAAIFNLLSLVLIALATKFVPASYDSDDDDEDRTDNYGWTGDEDRKLEFGDTGSDTFKVSQPTEKSNFSVQQPNSYSNPSSANAYSNPASGNPYANAVNGTAPSAPAYASSELSFVPPHPYDTSRTRTLASTLVPSSNGQSSILDEKNPSASQRDFTYMNETAVAPEEAPGLKLPNVYLDEDDTEGEENGAGTAVADDRLADSPVHGSDAGSSQSAFTSVSQRGVNPKYYRGAQQRVNIPPNGDYPFDESSNQPQYPMSSPYYPATVSPQPPQSFDGYHQSPQSAPAPPVHQYANPYRPSNSSQRSRSDVILNNSPDLIAGNMQKNGVRKYGLGQMNQQRYMQQYGAQPQGQQYGYNNYKRRQQLQQGFPTPSSMGEGPYGRLSN